MISLGWLKRIIDPYPEGGKLKFYDPITGEEAVVISKRLFRDTIREAYEMGAIDQEHGNADKTFRDAYVVSVAEELNL